jgi:hypothetical protein
MSRQLRSEYCPFMHSQIIPKLPAAHSELTDSVAKQAWNKIFVCFLFYYDVLNGIVLIPLFLIH